VAHIGVNYIIYIMQQRWLGCLENHWQFEIYVVIAYPSNKPTLVSSLICLIITKFTKDEETIQSQKNDKL
jgi:hypothetical protein